MVWIDSVRSLAYQIEKTAASPPLLEAIRRRAQTAAGASFYLLVPNASPHAEVTDAERRRHHEDAEHVLELALPQLALAAGRSVEGGISSRHDPMDAIEEALHDGEFDEVIISTLPNHVSSWLKADLPQRVQHLGLRVTTVTAPGRRTPETEQLAESHR